MSEDGRLPVSRGRTCGQIALGYLGERTGRSRAVARDLGRGRNQDGGAGRLLSAALGTKGNRVRRFEGFQGWKRQPFLGISG